jgi:hypothetical protein
MLCSKPFPLKHKFWNWTKPNKIKLEIMDNGAAATKLADKRKFGQDDHDGGGGGGGRKRKGNLMYWWIGGRRNVENLWLM